MRAREKVASTHPVQVTFRPQWCVTRRDAPITAEALVDAMARTLDPLAWSDHAEAEYAAGSWVATHGWEPRRVVARNQVRTALTAAARLAFRDPQEALVQAAYATPPVAALLRAIWEAAHAD